MTIQIAREREMFQRYTQHILFTDIWHKEHMVYDHSDNERERERNVLFNDALNTFYLRLYGIRHMVKDHSDSERGNPLPHGLLFPISSKGFICIIPDRITHTTAFVTAVVEHWLKGNIK